MSSRGDAMKSRISAACAAFAASALALSGCLADAPDEESVAEEEEALTAINKQLQNVGSGLCAAATNTVAVDELCANLVRQRWAIFPTGDGLHYIATIAPITTTGRRACMTVRNATPGAQVTLEPCDGSAAQKWRITTSSPYGICIAFGGCLGSSGAAGGVLTVGSSTMTSWLVIP